MTTSLKAALALLITITLWAYMAVVARGVVTVISPITVLFYRLLIAALCFLPLFIKRRPWEKPQFAKLLIISFGSTLNLTLFTVGLKYTSASVSQLIYAAMPILILIYGKIIMGEKQANKKIIGVLLGFSGLLLIGFMSAIEKGETITGSLLGNSLIFIAMLGWTSYLINSKSLSKYFRPIEMGATAIIVSFLVSFILLLINQLFFGGTFFLSSRFYFPIFYIGFAGTFLTYILYQYAIRHTSSLSVSLSSYIQPIITTLLAMVILGEKLTLHYVLGSVLIFSGVFLSSSFNIKSLRF